MLTGFQFHGPEYCQVSDFKQINDKISSVPKYVKMTEEMLIMQYPWGVD